MTIHARVLPLVLLAALFALPAPSAGARVAEEPGPAAAVAPSPLAGIRPRPRPKVDVPAAHLSRALFSMRQGDYSTALAAAGKAGPVARDIIEWHRLRAGGGRFDEVSIFSNGGRTGRALPTSSSAARGPCPSARASAR